MIRRHRQIPCMLELMLVGLGGSWDSASALARHAPAPGERMGSRMGDRPAERAMSGSEPTQACTTHEVEFTLQADRSHLHVGDRVRVTAKLRNVGCSQVGRPFFVLFESGTALRPATPLTADDPSEWSPEFVLHAVRSEPTTLSARVAFEVHLPPPGGAYESSAYSNEVPLTVDPQRLYVPTVCR